MGGMQEKERTALTETEAGTLNTEGRGMKLVIAGANNARKVFCRFLPDRSGTGFSGCLGAGCEAWRHWDDERGYCNKHLEDLGACQIYQQFEVA